MWPVNVYVFSETTDILRMRIIVMSGLLRDNLALGLDLLWVLLTVYKYIERLTVTESS